MGNVQLDRASPLQKNGKIYQKLGEGSVIRTGSTHTNVLESTSNAFFCKKILTLNPNHTLEDPLSKNHESEDV